MYNNHLTPPPPHKRFGTKIKITSLAVALSQVLLAEPVVPNPVSVVIPENAISFEAVPNGGASTTNKGDKYAKFNPADSTFSISEDNALGKTQIPANSTIVFRTHIDTTTHTGYHWYEGISGVVTNGGGSKTPKHININTPTAKVVLESIDPKASITSGAKKSPQFGEGGGSDINIIAQEFHIGSGKYTHQDLFAFMSGGNNTENAPAQFLAMNTSSGNKPLIKIQAHTYVHTDGLFAVGSQKGDYSFTLDGNLSVLGGGVGTFRLGQGEIPNPDFHINGDVHFKDAKILTFVPQNGIIKPWKLLSASGSIRLEGTQSVTGMLAFVLEDFVDISKAQDYGYSLQIKSDLYEYSVSQNNSAIYISPKLSEKAKKESVIKLINDGKNQIAFNYYSGFKEGSGDPEVVKALSAYLTFQGIDPNTGQPKEPTIQESPKDNTGRMGRTLLSLESKASSSITTSGFDSIDKKLALIKDGIDNALAETLKNSSNDLLAVNFVNTLSQPFNNTPIDLIDAIKSNIKQSSQTGAIFRQIEENLGAKLSIAQRLSSYNSKISNSSNSIQQTNSQDSVSFADTLSLQEQKQQELSNHLWFNLNGGGVIEGSSFGGSGGFILGYDTQINQSVLGAYFSYGYLSSKVLDLQMLSSTFTSHNLEAGLYSRIKAKHNEIDLVFKTLFALSNQTLETKDLVSNSQANFNHSYSEANLSYGYRFDLESLSLKPLIGLNIAFAYTPSYSQSGDIALDYALQSNFSLKANIGLELRANFSNNSFIYFIPSIEQGILNTQKDLKLTIAQTSFTQTLDSSLRTYAQILLGGEIGLGKDWSIGMNIGVKQGISGNKDIHNKWKNETYVSGNIGGVWRF